MNLLLEGRWLTNFHRLTLVDHPACFRVRRNRRTGGTVPRYFLLPARAIRGRARCTGSIRTGPDLAIAKPTLSPPLGRHHSFPLFAAPHRLLRVRDAVPGHPWPLRRRLRPPPPRPLHGRMAPSVGDDLPHRAVPPAYAHFHKLCAPIMA